MFVSSGKLRFFYTSGRYGVVAEGNKCFCKTAPSFPSAWRVGNPLCRSRHQLSGADHALCAFHFVSQAVQYHVKVVIKGRRYVQSGSVRVKPQATVSVIETADANACILPPEALAHAFTVIYAWVKALGVQAWTLFWKTTSRNIFTSQLTRSSIQVRQTVTLRRYNGEIWVSHLVSAAVCMLAEWWLYSFSTLRKTSYKQFINRMYRII